MPEKEIHLPYNFTRRSYQESFWQGMQTRKRGCLVWHRRSGKDKTALNFTIKEAFKRVGTYLYFLPKQRQARKVIWRGIDADGFRFMSHIPEELVKRRREDEMMIELINGSILQLGGADSYDAEMGNNAVGLVFSEYSLQDPAAWDFFRPIVRENKGWALFLFTPRGENHGFELYEMAKSLPDTWYTTLLTVADTKRLNGTPVITEADIEEERREGMDEAMIQQEYYCSFLGNVQGAYYAKLLTKATHEGRICGVPYDPTTGVITSWDIGIGDSCAIWFLQIVGQELHWINYYENHGEGIEFYINLLNEYKQKYGYIYLDHLAPHDIEANEFSSGTSPWEIAKNLGYEFTTVKRTPNVNIGIQNVRALLPRSWFDKEKCARGVQCLRNYHQVYDEKRHAFHDKPEHDWSSHGADAMRTYGEGKDLIVGGGMTAADAERLEREYGR